jgi:hypothetical protein
MSTAFGTARIGWWLVEDEQMDLTIDCWLAG